MQLECLDHVQPAGAFSHLRDVLVGLRLRPLARKRGTDQVV